MGTLACPVEDVTLRLAAPAEWASSSLVAPPDSLGASPVYNPGCDSAETGMRGTLFWTLPGTRVSARATSVSELNRSSNTSMLSAGLSGLSPQGAVHTAC